jgi:hypothetical protein
MVVGLGRNYMWRENSLRVSAFVWMRWRAFFGVAYLCPHSNIISASKSLAMTSSRLVHQRATDLDSLHAALLPQPAQGVEQPAV